MTNPLKYQALLVQPKALCSYLLLATIIISTHAAHIHGPEQLVTVDQLSFDDNDPQQLDSLAPGPATMSIPAVRKPKLETAQPRYDTQPARQHQSPRSQVFANKFILLTDGADIKLYPVQTSQGHKLELVKNFHYLIKPIEFNVDDPNTFRALRLDSPYLRWLLDKQTIQRLEAKGAHSKKAISILPTRDIGSAEIGSDTANKGNVNTGAQMDPLDEDLLYQGKSGWKRPWISEVDYFFDPYFCQDAPGACLVVVWLDTRNRFVRFGSVSLLYDANDSLYADGAEDRPTETTTIDIIESRQAKSTKASNTRDRVIWLREFAPIDVCRFAASFELTMTHCMVSGLVVDKVRGSLSLVLGPDQQVQNRKLSGKFQPELESGKQFTVDSYVRFDSCGANNTRNDLKNLLLDDNSGHWLFYLNKLPSGGRILAMNLEKETALDEAGLDKFAPQATLFDWASIQPSSSIRAIALDTKKHRLYWLLDDNQLYGSDYAGSNAQLVRKLSPKPAIRTPDRMQAFHGRLFISDSGKKSIIALSLEEHEPSQANQDPHRTTHQVLLVERSGIEAFRLLDLHDSIADDTLDYEQLGDQMANPDEQSNDLAGLFGDQKQVSAYEKLAARAQVPLGHCHDHKNGFDHSVCILYLVWLITFSIIIYCIMYLYHYWSRTSGLHVMSGIYNEKAQQIEG